MANEIERQILYVPDMAQLTGKTEAGVRSLIHKQKWDAIPIPRRLGGRVGWFLSDWNDWKKRMDDDKPKAYQPATYTQKGRQKGRPRKQPKQLKK